MTDDGGDPTSFLITLDIDENGFAVLALSDITLGTFSGNQITAIRMGELGIAGSNTNPGGPGSLTTTTVPGVVIPEPTSALFLASLAAGAGAVVRRRRK